ncbi:MAG: YhbY family RNA-binding protein [Nanoarchaeota archaeon]|nr:YhbY family RNA-binding protein [Nanoarchaeota archaeon]MBU4086147.1 YhbY family RNA-binding protein [Nanoarchaeota archaeon]
MAQIEMQIGKNGVIGGTLVWLENAFKTHEIVKVHVLKSAGHDKEKVRKISEEILEKLGKKYTCRIIGFTLVFRKWRREKR